MALHDRDYYRQSPQRTSPFGRMSLWSVTIWLVIINVIIYILDPILFPRIGYRPLLAWGYFSVETAINYGQVWRFITFQFLHDPLNLLHILFNMFVLFSFGRHVEAYLGPRRFLAFYLICGIAGPLMYMLFWAARLLIASPDVPMIGASAGVYGVLFAAARLAPDARVMVLFIPHPVKLKWVAIGLVVLSLFIVFTSGRNAGGEAAHLGGAAVGYLLISRAHWFNIFQFRRRRNTDQWQR
jgi:membrane associated rhomboid family serine protease